VGLVHGTAPLRSVHVHAFDSRVEGTEHIALVSPLRLRVGVEGWVVVAQVVMAIAWVIGVGMAAWTTGEVEVALLIVLRDVTAVVRRMVL